MPFTAKAVSAGFWTVIICAGLGRTFAQSQRASLNFDAATIRRAQPGPLTVRPVSGGPGTKDPELFTARKSAMLSLVMRAFDVKFRYQCVWLPWMEIEQYDLQAKVPPGATQEQFRTMLQNLLAERFGLKVHHETRYVSGYRLIAAKGGPKVTPSATRPQDSEAAESGDVFNAGSNGLPTGVVRGKDGVPELGPGDTPHDLVTRSGHFLRVRGENMERLAFRISRELQQPVTDATGLTGDYDFTLIWTPDRVVNRRADANAGSEPEAPPLIEALQRQLGLKLEPLKRRIAVDVLAVDYARKTPTEN